MGLTSRIARRYGPRPNLEKPIKVRIRHADLLGAIYLHYKTALARHPVKGLFNILDCLQDQELDDRILVFKESFDSPD